MFRECKRVVDLEAEMAHGAPTLAAAEQDLAGAPLAVRFVASWETAQWGEFE